MFEQDSNREREVRGKRIPFYGQVIILAVAVVLLLGACFLCFQIREVKVVGNFLYTEQQIVDASGISLGENLAVIQKAKTAGLIMKNLPFVDRVHIERVLPDTVVIYVAEADSSFAVRDKRGRYFLVTGGVVTEELDVLSVNGYPIVEGLNVITISVGDMLTTCVENPDAVAAARSILSLMDSYGVTGGVKKINVEVLIDVSMNYDGRFDVYFGDVGDIDRKVAYFVAMLENWDDGQQTGLIDLTFDADENARFQPYS